MSDGPNTERTPLLQPLDARNSHTAVSSAQEIDHVPTDAVGEGALAAPKFPDTSIANFGQDGLLDQISRTQFRLMFGGIVLSYFVSE